LKRSHQKSNFFRRKRRGLRGTRYRGGNEVVNPGRGVRSKPTFKKKEDSTRTSKGGCKGGWGIGGRGA